MKSIYKDVDWKKIKNFRNKIAHDYVNLDIMLIFGIIKTDLQKLKTDVIQIISLQLKNKTFDIEEFLYAKESIYYKHIDFDSITKQL